MFILFNNKLINGAIVIKIERKSATMKEDPSAKKYALILTDSQGKEEIEEFVNPQARETRWMILCEQVGITQPNGGV